jgi:hypothetical protein
MQLLSKIRELRNVAARKRNGNLPEMLTWGMLSFLLKCCVLSKDQLQTDSEN